MEEVFGFCGCGAKHPVYAKDSLLTEQFINIETLKTSKKLKPGMVVETLGYYEVNDGGGAKYIIRDKKEDDVEDNGTIHFINDKFVAEMIIENNTINIKQLGARPQDKQNNKYDIVPYIQVYLNYLDKVANRVKLYIPGGVWYSSGIEITKGFDIFGDFVFNLWTGDGTVLTSLNENQDYVIKIGNTLNYTRNFSLKNICITSADFVYSSDKNYFAFSTIKKIGKQCLSMIYSCFGIVDNLFFINIKGQPFKMSSCWEIYFPLLNFRLIDNLDDSIMCLGKADYTLMNNANITACNFEKIMFEGVHGDLIKVETDSNFAHNIFGTINFEDYSYVTSGTYTSLSSESSNYDDATAIHQSVFNIEDNAQFQNEVNNIQLNNFALKYYTDNEKQYIFDTIVKMGYDVYSNLIINNVSTCGCGKNIRSLLANNDGYCSVNTSVTFNNLLLDNTKCKYYVDTNGFTNIKVNNNINKIYSDNRFHFNSFLPYRTNLLQNISNKNRGNVIYDENLINDEMLGISLLNSKEYPTLNRKEIILPMLSKKLYIRAKLPSDSSISLQTKIINRDTKTSLATKNVDVMGSDEFKWYTFDYSDKENLNANEICNYNIEIYANNDIDYNIILDCFYFE